MLRSLVGSEMCIRDRYPRHRKLISLNKRFTGREDPEFNLRHDWNSLLDHPIPPMTSRTPERWPPADVLVGYLREFGEEQERAGRLVFNASVDRIDRTVPGVGDFNLQITLNGEARAVTCQVVVVAAGLWEPNQSPRRVPGIELALGYEELPATGEAFEAKTVAVLGLGNSAFETADALAPYANYVHLLNPSSNIPRPSWETRYPGSPRAINSGPWDAYLLKSLDGGFQPLNGCSLHRCKYTTRGGAKPSLEDVLRIKAGARDRFCIFPLSADATTGESWGAGLITISVSDTALASDWGREALEALGDAAMVMDWTAQNSKSHLYKVHRTHTARLDPTAVRERALQIHPANVTDSNVDQLMMLAASTGSPFPLVYDTVIRALGWLHNMSLYGSNALPHMQTNRKYAVMTSEYESVNVPNLHFAGTLSHGKDWKRSAGAFIHGFRYTARALHRILEKKHHGANWPSSKFKCDAAGIVGVADHTLRRINSASGPYQMIATLGDVILLRNDTGELEYVEELPVAYAHELFSKIPRVHWNFGYWKQRQSLHDSIAEGTKFEIHVWYSGATRTNGRRLHSRDLLRLIEAFQTDWDNDITRSSLELFIASKAALAAKSACAPEVHDMAKRWVLSLDRENLQSTPRVQGEGPRSSLTDWTPTEIDLLVHNHLSVAVSVMRNSNTEGVLQPGEGRTVLGHDGDLWEAHRVPNQKDAKPVKSMVLDIGMGKVQDFFVAEGGVEECAASDQLELGGSDEPEVSDCDRLLSNLARNRQMQGSVESGIRQLEQARERLGCPAQ
eukprot:TRINITY_DN6801_c0_g1_i8.p1 TRINITY_DN6801_c0_g1~~TRINITY_DN6801_c0_g1_i8.p1  ORF type:complete len:791 (+),score=140.24 TRINITY_DN6801_c0_g1_i8:152-2524(+)